MPSLIGIGRPAGPRRMLKSPAKGTAVTEPGERHPPGRARAEYPRGCQVSGEWVTVILD